MPEGLEAVQKTLMDAGTFTQDMAMGVLPQ